MTLEYSLDQLRPDLVERPSFGFIPEVVIEAGRWGYEPTPSGDLVRKDSLAVDRAELRDSSDPELRPEPP